MEISLWTVGAVEDERSRATRRALQKSMEASDRKRQALRQRQKSSMNEARWITGSIPRSEHTTSWTPGRMQPEATTIKLPHQQDRRSRSRTVRPTSAELRADSPNSGWFEVGQTRTHSGSWPSWYTTAVDGGAVSSDGQMRMAVFHRPPSPERSGRPNTAAGQLPEPEQFPVQTSLLQQSPGQPQRPHSAGDIVHNIPVGLELSSSIQNTLPDSVNGMLDETGQWQSRKVGDDVYTATVAAVGGMQAHGAAMSLIDDVVARPPMSMRPRLQNAPVRTRRPASAVSIAQDGGTKHLEVVEWLGKAQLSDATLVQEAEGLLARHNASAGGYAEAPRPAHENGTGAGGGKQERPGSAALSIVEPECAGAHGYGGAEKRAVPHRPWTREEAVAYSVAQDPDALTLAGEEVRADLARDTTIRYILEARTMAAEDQKRKKEQGCFVHTGPRRSYDKGIGYGSLLRPCERADGRCTWGLLEWPVDLAPVKVGGDRTSWGS